MQVASSTDGQNKANRRRPRAVHFVDTFTFRLPAEVSTAVRASADDCGKSKSEWLRAVILREVNVDRPRSNQSGSAK